MDFSLWASGFPGLLWEIEHRRSRIRLLNGWTLPSLGENTSRLLKDAQFRRRVVMKSDHTLLCEFWEMVTSRQSAMVSFRLSDNPHQAYLLQGWPDPADPEKYFGMLKDAVLPATFVANGTAGTCQLALGHAQYPVLVLSLDEKEIVTCNEAAQALFAGAARGGGDFMLEDIAPGEMGETLLGSCRHALEKEIWAGTLMLRSGSGSILGSKVRISPCSTGTDIVRIALLNIPETPASCSLVSCPEGEGEIPSLKEGLERLLARCPGVEGLIHVSEMSWSQHLRSAQDFLKVGDEVEAVILTLDREERKMSLGIKQLTGYARQHQVHRLGHVHSLRSALLLRQAFLFRRGAACGAHLRLCRSFARRVRRSGLPASVRTFCPPCIQLAGKKVVLRRSRTQAEKQGEFSLLPGEKRVFTKRCIFFLDYVGPFWHE